MTDIGVFFAYSYHSKPNIMIDVSWISQYSFISVFLSWISTILCIIIMKNKFLQRPSILIVKNYFGIHAQCMHAWVCTFLLLNVLRYLSNEFWYFACVNTFATFTLYKNYFCIHRTQNNLSQNIANHNFSECYKRVMIIRKLANVKSKI